MPRPTCCGAPPAGERRSRAQAHRQRVRLRHVRHGAALGLPPGLEIPSELNINQPLRTRKPEDFTNEEYADRIVEAHVDSTSNGHDGNHSQSVLREGGSGEGADPHSRLVDEESGNRHARHVDADTEGEEDASPLHEGAQDHRPGDDHHIRPNVVFDAFDQALAADTTDLTRTTATEEICSAVEHAYDDTNGNHHQSVLREEGGSGGGADPHSSLVDEEFDNRDADHEDVDTEGEEDDTQLHEGAQDNRHGDDPNSSLVDEESGDWTYAEERTRHHIIPNVVLDAFDQALAADMHDLTRTTQEIISSAVEHAYDDTNTHTLWDQSLLMAMNDMAKEHIRMLDCSRSISRAPGPSHGQLTRSTTTEDNRAASNEGCEPLAFLRDAELIQIMACCNRHLVIGASALELRLSSAPHDPIP